MKKNKCKNLKYRKNNYSITYCVNLFKKKKNLEIVTMANTVQSSTIPEFRRVLDDVSSPSVIFIIPVFRKTLPLPPCLTSFLIFLLVNRS